MISERQQIAERFRPEGVGEADKIIGDKEKDMQRIESEAYREVQTIKGWRMRKPRKFMRRLITSRKYPEISLILSKPWRPIIG
jgi:hypothetical protein